MTQNSNGFCFDMTAFLHSKAVSEPSGLVGKPNTNFPWSDAYRYPRGLPHVPVSLSSEGLRAHREARQSYPRHAQNPALTLLGSGFPCLSLPPARHQYGRESRISPTSRAAKGKQNPQVLHMYYFICGKKWHTGQGPNFKFKQVVQCTTLW